MKKGFTLIELLVVVLIIGVLAAIALPQYFKAVERSRMSEAEQLLTAISQAQQRKYLQLTEFATDYRGLDVSPKGSTGTAFCTKGVVPAALAGSAILGSDATTGTCENGNGFLIGIVDGVWGKGDGTDRTTAAPAGVGYGVAKRVNGANTGNIQYQYELLHYYANNVTACRGANKNGAALCADFCGLDTLEPNKFCCNDGSSAMGGNGGQCPIPAKAGAIN